MQNESDIQRQWKTSDLYRRLMSEMRAKVAANERLNPLLERLSSGLEFTPEMIEFARLQQESEIRELSILSQELVKKIRFMAESIYQESWNFYSGALNPPAASVFEESILAISAYDEPIDYLEIGSCQGLSMSFVTCFLKHHSKLGQAVSVDPYFDEGYQEGHNGIWGISRNIPIDKLTRDKAYLLYKKLDVDVEHIEKESHAGLSDLIKQDRQFDLIYIDGSHEKMMPLRDLGLSLQLIRRGGVIMLDDHNWPDVKPLKELCDKHCIKIAESWKISAYRI